MAKRKDSLDAERGLIGSLLLSPKKVMEACIDRGVNEACFSDGLPPRNIFKAVSEMVASGKKIDLITVTEYMDSKKTLSAAGGAEGVADAVVYVPTAANYETYLDIVLKNAAVRIAKQEMAQKAKELDECIDTEDVRAVLVEAFKEPLAIIKPSTNDDEDKALLMGYVDSVEDRANGTTQTVKSTPFETLNNRAGGTGAGEVTGVLGLPSSGKSILGKQFSLHNLVQHEMPTMIVTGEMPYQQWMDRAICEMGIINFKAFRNGRLNQQEQKSLVTTISRISKMPLYVYDRKRLRMDLKHVEAAIRREAKTHGVKCVLIDYLQLIKSSGGKKELRTDQEIGEVSCMLKDMAVNYGMHIIALCAESDDGKVRNSREPEYDFDNIIKLIVRQEKNPRTGDPMIITDKAIVTKWRDSERGYVIRLEMEGQYCRFRDITGPNG